MKVLSDFHYQLRQDGLAYLTEDLVVDLEKGYQGSHEFTDLEHGTFATLENSCLTIFAGTTSDLCSPAFVVKGRRIGVHSGTAEAFGAFVHDITRRVRRLKCSPFTRKDTDDFFWDALHVKKSRLRRTYHFAVSSFIGTAFIWITEGAVDCYCRKCKNEA